MTELIKDKDIISWDESNKLHNLDVGESVLEILDIDNINNSFWKLIISQKIVNIDTWKSRDELIKDFLDFWNSIIKEYKEKYEKDFKENKNRFWLLDFYIYNWIKEPLKNSFDSFISAHSLWNDNIWEISFKMYKIDNWLIFIIRDNWAWLLTASTFEKNNNQESYIWWKWIWLWTLNTEWYWKYCKSYYRVWKELWAVTKVVIKILD